MWALETCTAAETQPLPTKKTGVCFLFVNSLHLYHSRGGCNRHTGILAGAGDMETPMAPTVGTDQAPGDKENKETAGWRRNIRVCDGLREKRMTRDLC